MLCEVLVYRKRIVRVFFGRIFFSVLMGDNCDCISNRMRKMSSASKVDNLVSKEDIAGYGNGLFEAGPKKSLKNGMEKHL